MLKNILKHFPPSEVENSVGHVQLIEQFINSNCNVAANLYTFHAGRKTSSQNLLALGKGGRILGKRENFGLVDILGLEP